MFVVCTANSIDKLPPELTRAERFDATFFVDMPSVEERTAIWKTYRKKYSLKAPDEDPDTDRTFARISENWTGAEIKTACRLCAMLRQPLLEAMKLVIPVYERATTELEALRTWAEGKCLSASVPGKYVRPKAKAKTVQTIETKPLKRALRKEPT